MAHIELMAPVAHIWYLKGIPSKLSLTLDMKIKDLEKICYYESYVVLDPGDTELKKRELLSEQEFHRAREEFGNRFRAGMGAEALETLLEELDLEAEIKAIEDELELEKKQQQTRTRIRQKTKKLIRRLRVLKGFYDSGIEPKHMIMRILPVIPPELRPMIQLERGRFATSDVNDLYRRVINRNNRLKKLMDLRTPDIIIRNEKRMLQEAVDALIDNSRVDRPVRGPNNRPLKSMTDLLKGKQGRFRQNLLGKRVDYSGRAVIVNGPSLDFNQCGLPKKMAIELFKPFIMQRLVNENEAASIKSAKKMIEREEDEVWDALEEVIEGHPVLLNRAPTLHRLGIQAYYPQLTEGHSIRLHPLQCPPYNADYDGDQMAVHIPLSKTAQIESRVLMMSTNNLLSPAHGGVLPIPTQDMVIGINYLTKLPADLDLEDEEQAKHVFRDPKHVEWAVDQDAISLHDPIIYQYGDERHLTTPGRVRFNEALADGIPFQNCAFNEDEIGELIGDHIDDIGVNASVESLDNLKEVGYHESTLMGGSIGYEDLLTPDRKEELLEEGDERVAEINRMYEEGEIVEEERYNRSINVWHEITQEISDNVFETMSRDMNGFNPVYMMADSGARGSAEQIRQLAGMRGLMAKPSGEVIEIPIKSSFRDGLSVMEYFISTHGARKGLADTALKTADAGYLTRRLADVAQSVRIVEPDCGTLEGVEVSPIRSSGEVLESMTDRILGRVARRDIKHPQTGEMIVEENEEIDEEKAKRIQDCGFESVEIRSLLTCESEDGVCAKCYGRDLSSRRIVNIGEPVGIIAAQSIGEPGTQLTMRTFHTGGAAEGGGEHGIVAESDVYIEQLPDNVAEYEEEDGSIVYVSLTDEGTITLRRVKDSLELEQEDAAVDPVAFEGLWVYGGDTIATIKEDGEEREVAAANEGIVHMDEDEGVLRVLGNEYTVDIGLGARIQVGEEDIVEEGGVYVEVDPYNELIIAEFNGEVSLRDVEVGRTLKEQVDETTGLINKVVTEDKQGKKFPSLVLKRDDTQATRRYDLPYDSILVAEDGQEVQAGEVLAKMPKGDVQTKDITGGLPRVEDLFEARKRSKESAKIAEISGEVEFIKEEKRKEKGIRTIQITNPRTENSKKYRVKPGVHVKVREGELIEEGTPLTEGYVNPHDLLRIQGMSTLQNYLVEEVQKVYKQQGIVINDKHIEVIIRQMLRRVMITDSGDTQLLPGERADRYRLARINENIQQDGGDPATFTPILQGITKASLQTDSFISAASFQDTKRVLSNAACQGKVDELAGLKENVITGHLIPAGTGFQAYRDMFKDDLRDVVEKARDYTREEESEETEEAEEVSATS
jgi:DNA-directed RNA polymerase subunit beta'